MATPPMRWRMLCAITTCAEGGNGTKAPVLDYGDGGRCCCLMRKQCSKPTCMPVQRRQAPAAAAGRRRRPPPCHGDTRSALTTKRLRWRCCAYARRCVPVGWLTEQPAATAGGGWPSQGPPRTCMTLQVADQSSARCRENGFEAKGRAAARPCRRRAPAAPKAARKLEACMAICREVRWALHEMQCAACGAQRTRRRATPPHPAGAFQSNPNASRPSQALGNMALCFLWCSDNPCLPASAYGLKGTLWGEVGAPAEEGGCVFGRTGPLCLPQHHSKAVVGAEMFWRRSVGLKRARCREGNEENG